MDPVLLSIPGISFTLTSIIMAEIFDINKFDTPSQLQSFADLDPANHQSGKFVAKDVSMVKRA